MSASLSPPSVSDTKRLIPSDVTFSHLHTHLHTDQTIRHFSHLEAEPRQRSTTDSSLNIDPIHEYACMKHKLALSAGSALLDSQKQKAQA